MSVRIAVLDTDVSPDISLHVSNRGVLVHRLKVIFFYFTMYYKELLYFCAVLFTISGMAFYNYPKISSLNKILLPVNKASNSASHQGIGEYEIRRQTMLDNCQGKAIEYKSRGNLTARLKVDDKHRLLYCPIAKVASTFWKGLLQVLTGIKQTNGSLFPGVVHDNSLPTLSTVSLDVAHWIMNNYTSFLFVRNPYTRLLACYIDKFFATNVLYWNVGKIIIRRYREKPSNVSLLCGHDVTFPEFIKHVISSLERSAQVNEHWIPMYRACGPCGVQYDVIGKLETISQDVGYIVQNHIVHNNTTNDDIGLQADLARLNMGIKFLFRHYRRSDKRCISLPEALHRYLRILQIRGMISKSVTWPDWFKSDANVSVEAVRRFIVDKYKQSKDRKLLKLNRKEAFIEAYSHVPLADRIKLQKLYKPDFDIFGYPPQPPELFGERGRDDAVNKFYFDI